MKARRFKPTSSKTKRNLGCWIYGEIYHVRNDFLHGNPVDAKSLIVKRSGRNLFSYASILYRMALTGFVDLQPPAPTNPAEWSRARFDFHSNQGDIEEALLSVLISSKKGDSWGATASVKARARLTSSASEFGIGASVIARTSLKAASEYRQRAADLSDYSES